MEVYTANRGTNDKLIEAARRLGRHRTKTEAVTAALNEYIIQRRQLEVLQLFGTVDFDPNYSYKAERRKR